MCIHRPLSKAVCERLGCLGVYEQAGHWMSNVSLDSWTLGSLNVAHRIICSCRNSSSCCCTALTTEGSSWVYKKKPKTGMCGSWRSRDLCWCIKMSCVISMHKINTSTYFLLCVSFLLVQKNTSEKAWRQPWGLADRGWVMLEDIDTLLWVIQTANVWFESAEPLIKGEWQQD